jgi:hypothetical protein
MLIIHPPLTKPCEPPAALAYLAGALEKHGIAHTLFDLNIEALEYLFCSSRAAEDTWSKRAFKNYRKNLKALRSPDTYTNMDRYKRAVADSNRVLEIAGKRYGLRISLSNYQDSRYSPLTSSDLLDAAADFRENIFFPYFSTRFFELFSQEHTAVVGFSLNYLSQALCTFAMIGYLRKHWPEKKIIVGGGLATTWLSHPRWSNPFAELIDLFFAGRGEQSLIRFLKKTPDSSAVQPLFTALQDNNYLSPGFILPYTSSYGCFWKRCNFCPETSEGTAYSHNQPTRTIDELTDLCDRTAPSLIHLLDNALSPSTLGALAENQLAAPWYGFARFDGLLADPDFCLRLKRSGCVMLKLGLESGDQRVLEKMNKGILLSVASQVLANLHQVGIATYIYLLFGTPAEDLEAALRTMDFIETHHQQITFVNLAIFNLPLDSDQHGLLETTPFSQGDLSIYQDFKHPLGWERKKIRSFLATRFKRSPEIAEILRNDPPFFTSNHAPFLLTAVKKKSQ